MPTISTIEFLQALYPEPLPAGKLVLWTRSKEGQRSRSDWVTSLDRAARLARKYRHSKHVYFGVALQDGDAALALARQRRPRASLAMVRGAEASAVALPALWIDVDVAGPGHRAMGLPPDRAAARALLEAVPVPPSILVWTGGGYHAYWLLREPWLLADDEARATAGALVRRLQAAVRARAAAQGWTVDHTADLARVLRLPGTLNHKSAVPEAVTIELFPRHIYPGAQGSDDRRYQPADFAALPPDPAPAAGAAPAVGRRDEQEEGPPADFRAVYKGCSWLRHCHADRERLPEPEWYAALSIVGRCAAKEADGRGLAHWISRDHPDYEVAATDAKLQQALSAAGARTCAFIAHRLGAEGEHCGVCRHFGEIKSPIVLGRREKGGTSEKGAREKGGTSESSTSESSTSESTAEKGADRGVSEAVSEAAGTSGSPRTSGSPPKQPVEVMVTTREHEVNDQALVALAAGEANLFERAGNLVQVIASRLEMPGTLRHAPGSPLVKPLVEPRLRELLARHCSFVVERRGKRGLQRVPAHPPQWTARALLGRGMWEPVRRLTGVVEGPVLRADGSVLQEPGYDPQSGLLYRPNARFEVVPAQPTAAAVQAALALVRETVCDFPFASEAHFAAWLSSLLTPLARFAFAGPSPLNLIDANVRGAGKSLLVDVVSTIFTGRPAARMSHGRDEEELRKTVTTLALEAIQLVLIDNVRGAFGSATLDRTLTATTWRDRLLGANAQVEIPLAITWYATGNNIFLRGDTPRRCLHIRLESPEERPEARTTFRHPRLLRWLEDERARLLPAALTLLRAYVAAGRPDPGLAGWGSFEQWSDLVRGAIVWLGLADPADTREDLETAADSERSLLADLVPGLDELLTRLGGAATAREIVNALEGDEGDRYARLRAAVEEMFPRLRAGTLPTPAQLGHRLRAFRGRVVDGLCIEQAKRSNTGRLWEIRRLL